MATWLYIVLCTWFALSAVVTIAVIGRPREPIGRDTAVVNLLICAAFIVMLSFWGVV